MKKATYFGRASLLVALLYYSNLALTPLYGQCEINGPDVICADMQATYTVTFSSGSNILWDVGGQGTIIDHSADNKSITVKWNNYPTTGFHTVELSYSDGTTTYHCDKVSTVYPHHDNQILYDPEDFDLSD